MSLLTNLVAHWKLNEASGTRFDSHGSNDLEDNNTVASATGKIGDAASFVRANAEYLSTTSESIAVSDGVDWSIALWFNRANTVNTHRLCVFNSATLIRAASSNLQVIAGTILTVSGVATTGWHYVIVQWRAASSDFRCVVDNVATTLTPAGALTGSTGLTLSGLTDSLDGLIDSATFWDRQLTTDEEIQLWNSGNGLDYEDFAGEELTTPEVTDHPDDATKTEGESVSFSVTATGNPSPTYQWRKDGEDIPGATSDTYEIAVVALADAGDYDCVVTNSEGFDISDPATLTVNEALVAPTVTDHPNNATKTEGQTVTFTVTATGNPTPTYQWRKDEEEIEGATSASYQIVGVAEEDEGDYDCVVTNSEGSDTSDPATLTVNEAVEGGVVMGARLRLGLGLGL